MCVVLHTILLVAHNSLHNVNFAECDDDRALYLTTRFATLNNRAVLSFNALLPTDGAAPSADQPAAGPSTSAAQPAAASKTPAGGSRTPATGCVQGLSQLL